MEIYADLFVLINCLCDGLLLLSCALLLKKRVKLFRLALSSLLGGGYAFVYLLLYRSPVSTGILSLCTSLAMVLCFFGYHGFSIFLKRVLLFYLLSFLLGGAVGAVHSLLLTYVTPSQKGALLILLLLLAALLGCCLLARAILFKRQQTALLSFTLGGESYRVKGLLDSGNLVKDPLSCRPVVLLDPKILKYAPLCDRTVFINTVTGQKALPAVLPDKAAINGTSRDLCIALCPPPKQGYGNTSALLPFFP
jgi:stage II sporulation protein GA (sporulation sigma-E factor processing peptidase)